MCASNLDKVRCFHLNFCRPIGQEPNLENGWFRIELIEEETDELVQAMREKDVVGVADALADLLYVAYGAGVEFGIDLDKVFAEVHRSNMSKMGADGKPLLRSDGKVLKGENYEPPDIKGALR